jgi:hypothetical protein
LKPVAAWICSRTPISHFLTNISLGFCLLSGCVAIPLPGVGLVFAPVPLSGAGNLDMPDYSLGPVSSEQFPDLIRNAIPPSEGAVHVFGRVQLSLLLDGRSYLLSAVAALTDTDMVLLKWYDPEEDYEILARLPYTDILSVSTNSLGLGRIVYLCLATTVFAWGDQTYPMGQHASMSFIKTSGIFADTERTEDAISLLQEMIKPVDGACDAPVEEAEGSVEAASQ